MQSQARQRIAYYKKCGYKIKDTNDNDDKKKKPEVIEYGFVDDD
jgi:hypothetical protein